MPKLDNTGPDGEGTKTGRKLGKCYRDNEQSEKLGIGQGKRRNAGGGDGKGKRLQTYKQINQ